MAGGDSRIGRNADKCKQYRARHERGDGRKGQRALRFLIAHGKKKFEAAFPGWEVVSGMPVVPNRGSNRKHRKRKFYPKPGFSLMKERT